MATNFLSTVLSLLVRWPPGLAVMGVGLLLVSVYGDAYYWQVSQTFPRKPIHISVATAAAMLQPGEATWVTLDNVVWDCSYLRYGQPGDVYTQSDIGFTDSTRSVRGIASFHRPAMVACNNTASLQSTGVLTVVRSQASDVSMRLCTWCGRNNTRSGIIVCAVGSAMGALFLFFAIRRWVRQKRLEAQTPPAAS